MAQRTGFEPVVSSLRGKRLSTRPTLHVFPAPLIVDREGVEPSLEACKATVLPLNERPSGVVSPTVTPSSGAFP